MTFSNAGIKSGILKRIYAALKNYKDTTIIAGGGITTIDDIIMYKDLGAKHFAFSKNGFNGNQRYFFGLGPQADRYLLNLQKTKQAGFSPTVVGPFGAHASNVFVYSFICAGFLGLSIFLLINLFLLSKILFVLKNHSALQLKHNYL